MNWWMSRKNINSSPKNWSKHLPKCPDTDKLLRHHFYFLPLLHVMFIWMFFWCLKWNILLNSDCDILSANKLSSSTVITAIIINSTIHTFLFLVNTNWNVGTCLVKLGLRGTLEKPCRVLGHILRPPQFMDFLTFPQLGNVPEFSGFWLLLLASPGLES